MKLKFNKLKLYLHRKLKMFNIYKHMQQNAEKDQKETEFTGHDRFYQERSRSSFRFTCCSYDGQTEHINVNEVYKDLFASKNKLVISLPPTSAALFLSFFFKPEVSIPCPSSWGWTKEKESWTPEWSAVTAIWSQLSLLDHCGCKSGCETMRCGCRRVSLPCTAQCKSCKGGCTNQKKKKRRGACRRAQSVAELNPESIAAATRRDAFRIRSVSTDKDESEEENSEKAPLVAQKIDSLAKLLFNKSIIGSGSGKSSPSEPPSSPKVAERPLENSAVFEICSEYLSQSSRYELISQLSAIGSRPNKHWFAVHDNSIKTDRLLTLMPLPSKCPIEFTERSRALIVELFRSLHHPYIYPVLDLEECSGHAVTVMPFNSRGSLKDLIYKSTWSEEYSRKYDSGGTGLPAWQVARFGRQILEGLTFLKEKGFPPFRHLHSGNVMVQNGVARICALENTMIGARPRTAAAAAEHVETLRFGRVLYEMCAGADLDLSLLADLMPNYPQIVEMIEFIFGPRTPNLHELLLCEVFRKIDLREMKGSCLPNFNQRLSRSCLSLLGEVARRQPGYSGYHTPPSRVSSCRASPSTPPARRRHFPVDQDYTEECQW